MRLHSFGEMHDMTRMICMWIFQVPGKGRRPRDIPAVSPHRPSSPSTAKRRGHPFAHHVDRGITVQTS